MCTTPHIGQVTAEGGAFVPANVTGHNTGPGPDHPGRRERGATGPCWQAKSDARVPLAGGARVRPTERETTVKQSLSLSLIALAAAAPALAQTAEAPLAGTEVLPLSQWSYDDLYAGGISAEEFIDEKDVHDPTGEEIGDVEDILIGPDGRVLAIVAEVGGLWDIGDTHVSVPIAQVRVDGDRVTVPITEDQVDDFDLWGDDDVYAAQGGDVGGEVVVGIDDLTLPRVWRATEIIGDTARLSEPEGFANYGYVNDLILRDGQVAAVVVDPTGTYGTGYRAYPYTGYGRGWTAGTPYYDMPYRADEVGEMEQFDYERIMD